MPPLDLYDVGFVGAVGAGGVSPDFESNYDNTSDWTQISTGIDVDTTVNDACVSRIGGGSPGNINREVYQNIGFTLSDTTWCADSEFLWLEPKLGASGMPFIIGTTFGQHDAMTNIGYQEQEDDIKLYLQDYYSSVQQTAVSPALTPSQVYYPRLQRLTATTTKLELFETAYGSGSIGSAAHTITALITGLDTLNHSNNDGEQTSTTQNWNITQTQIWDGVTTPP